MKDKILGTFIAAPSTNLVGVLSHSGYSLEAAIADLVDNCITAEARNVYINYDHDKKRISILDDGNGMDENKLREAITYAFKNINDERKITDTGRYSIGLNSASSSFCKYLLVTSKTKKSEQHSIGMDFNHLENSGKWEIFELENRSEFKIKFSSGTYVVWEDLKIEEDPITNANILNNDELILPYLSKIESHLSKTFFRFIKKGKLNIYLNGSKIEGWNPFLEHDDTQQFTDVIFADGLKVKIEGYILPPVSHLSPRDKDLEFGDANSLEMLQGFYVYRGDRLISGGGWLNIPELNITPKANYARIAIYVDNRLDKYFSINFAKNTLNIPSEFERQILPFAKMMRKYSADNADYKKVPRPHRKNKEPKSLPWVVSHTENGIKAEINQEHPVIKMICSELPARKRKMLFSLLAKSLPIGQFENYKNVDDPYTEDEIIELLEMKYEDYKKANKTKKEIIDLLAKTSPFCEERYRQVVAMFLGDKDE